MSGREGFAENANMKEFIRFVETIQDAPSEDDSEGNEFYTDFVKPVISIKDNEIDSLENAERILSLYNRLSEISTNENDSDSEYIAKVVERFKDHSDDPGDDKQKPKINKAEDDKQKPKINKAKKSPSSIGGMKDTKTMVKKRRSEEKTTKNMTTKNMTTKNMMTKNMMTKKMITKPKKNDYEE